MDTKHLLAEALLLSDEERAALAGELIQSLEREVDVDAEAAWSAEIRSRLDRIDAGTAITVRGRKHVVGFTRRLSVALVLEYLESTRTLIVAVARGHRRPGYWRDHV